MEKIDSDQYTGKNLPNKELRIHLTLDLYSETFEVRDVNCRFRVDDTDHNLDIQGDISVY